MYVMSFAGDSFYTYTVYTLCMHACGGQRTACRIILLCGFQGEDSDCWAWWHLHLLRCPVSFLVSLDLWGLFRVKMETSDLYHAQTVLGAGASAEGEPLCPAVDLS